jgi:hypothetical protein
VLFTPEDLARAMLRRLMLEVAPLVALVAAFGAGLVVGVLLAR